MDLAECIIGFKRPLGDGRFEVYAVGETYDISTLPAETVTAFFRTPENWKTKGIETRETGPVEGES